MNGIAAKNGNSLAIPERPATEIATGFHLQIRRQVAEIQDIEAIEEGRRRIQAWQAYVTKKEQRSELQAAARWCELRIGELLGKGERGNPNLKRVPITPVGEISGIGREDRHKFRQLAEHKQLVAKLIAGGQVSRQQILAAIKETRPPIISSHAAKTVGALDELDGAKFGCIYADPPWRYGNQGTRAATRNHYNTLSANELCELPVAATAEKNAHLHLWTTNAFLPDAFRVIEAWGFEYRSCYVWVKPQMGIGNYWRVSHEFLLLGIRGNAKRFKSHSLKSWGEFSRTRHSSKPENIRDLIEKASNGPYLELFGRKPISGWTVLGNQIGRRLFV